MHEWASSQSRNAWVLWENCREAPNSACTGRGAQLREKGVTEEITLSSRMVDVSQEIGKNSR